MIDAAIALLLAAVIVALALRSIRRLAGLLWDDDAWLDDVGSGENR